MLNPELITWATPPGLCDWCDMPATVALPDLPADDGGPWITSVSVPRDSRACFAHDVMWGVGRSVPLSVVEQAQR